ncbi:hypothetical protein [Mucilaginibacter agri]|uniref:Uncharacterized protein n=1 Tax=Mucilaginibacter agri TaxID=2695265 RepID=A0A966DS29_9SPHI|nr:hypothetical protein [Mucilaginibacter agri]NCD67901.1 hypothetical protein [Mucilaginibacter agri]
MKKQILSPFDHAIMSLAQEFAKIPDYEQKMKDPDLKKLHTFVAVGIMSIHDAKSLVVGSFVPAANKVIANAKNQFNRSIFKQVLTSLNYDLEATRHETIRLGYVFAFHKFEVFIKQLMELMDELADIQLMPLNKFAKTRFNFEPTQWFRNQSVHVVNFISNCTKHQDGLCKLSNPAYALPAEFIGHSPDEKIARTVQQFKSDIDALIAAVVPLIKALNSVFLYRTFEQLSEPEKPIAGVPSMDEVWASVKNQQELLIKLTIGQYENNPV